MSIILKLKQIIFVVQSSLAWVVCQTMYTICILHFSNDMKHCLGCYPVPQKAGYFYKCWVKPLPMFDAFVEITEGCITCITASEGGSHIWSSRRKGTRVVSPGLSHALVETKYFCVTDGGARCEGAGASAEEGVEEGGASCISDSRGKGDPTPWPVAA